MMRGLRRALVVLALCPPGTPGLVGALGCVLGLAPMVALAQVPAAAAPEARPAAPEARPGTAGSTFPVVVDETYRIGPEDVLEVSVWKEEGLRKEVLVRPDGAISFPLAGDVRAQGRSVEEVRTELAARLAKFIPEPVVSLLVLKVASNRIYVLGRVNKPGEYTAGRVIDVLQALAMAGGLNAFADEKDIRVVRRESGRSVVLRFDYNAVSRGREMQQNVVLQGGDVVLVP